MGGGGPAILTITFGEGVPSDGPFFLTINGVPYSISFGQDGGADVPIYRDNEGSLETYPASYIANAFASYITATFSSSLTVTTPSSDVVTLTTVATSGASLSAVCALPIFPNVPLVGFNPLSLSPAMWLSDTGSDASVWTDLSGNGRNAVQATTASQPAIITNALNGRQIRRFNGTDNYLSHSYSAPVNNTIFAVCFNTQTTSNVSNTIFTAADAGTPLRSFMLSQANVNNYWSTYRTGFISSGYTLRSSFEIISIVSTAAGVSLKHGANAAQFTADTGFYTDPTLSRKAIGAAYDATGEFNLKGDLAELIVFPSALNNTDRQSVETYLRDRWNLGPALIDAVFVLGAGTEDANGLYVPDGTSGGRTAYINNASGVGILWNGEEYRIGQSSGWGDHLYVSNNIAGSPNTYPWNGIYITTGEGSDPPPTVRQATTADTP